MGRMLEIRELLLQAEAGKPVRSARCGVRPIQFGGPTQLAVAHRQGRVSLLHVALPGAIPAACFLGRRWRASMRRGLRTVVGVNLSHVRQGS